MRGVLVVILLAGCGGGGATTSPDAGIDAGVDASPAPDAGPTGFVPDPVTMGEDLPSVIPVMKVNVGGATVMLDVEVPGTIEVYEDPSSPTPTLTAPIGFEGRGNFTWTLPKKGYGFELQDGAGAELDRELLGMPPGADFALYACYTDKTCLRNALVFAVGQSLGRWSPRTRFVELYLDDAYQGLYMVWERIRRDPARVDVSKTGGVIVRHEGGPEGDGSDFQTTSGVWYRYQYPKTPTAAIATAWQAMEDALAGGDTSVIDVGSWVDRAIVEEVTNNWDGYVHSIYMTKDGDGPIAMGPLWDFDLAFANGNVTGYNCMTNVWAYQIVRGYPDDVPAYWLARWTDPEFQRLWKCRYQELRAGALSDATFSTRIDTWVAFTADARARDQARWPTIGTSVFPNCTTEPTYDADVTYLRDWITARLAWLDAQAAAIAGGCP